MTFPLFLSTACRDLWEVRSNFRVTAKKSEMQRFQKLISCLEASLSWIHYAREKSLRLLEIFLSLQTVLRLMAADKFQSPNRETCGEFTAPTSGLSAGSTSSLSHQMSEHPRCQRQTFTSRSFVFASHL